VKRADEEWHILTCGAIVGIPCCVEAASAEDLLETVLSYQFEGRNNA
jgi:hypothetical protein